MTALHGHAVAALEPARITASGDHVYVELGASVRASIRVSDDGRIWLDVPSGELAITQGAKALVSALGLALRVSAQLRAVRAPRRGKRARR
jgi:hypothetical protein